MTHQFLEGSGHYTTVISLNGPSVLLSQRPENTVPDWFLDVFRGKNHVFDEIADAKVYTDEQRYGLDYKMTMKPR